MKRCVFGAALLIVLLAAGLLLGRGVNALLQPEAEELCAARDASAAGDWDAARACALRARQSWEENWHLLAALTDHELMEQADVLFAQLVVFGNPDDRQSFAALCAALQQQLKALEDTHKPSWWNIL